MGEQDRALIPLVGVGDGDVGGDLSLVLHCTLLRSFGEIKL